MAANMKAVKLRIKKCGKHHADYQGYGTCGVLQAAKWPRSGRIPAVLIFRSCTVHYRK